MLFFKKLDLPQAITQDNLKILLESKNSKDSRKYLYVSQNTEYLLSEEIKDFFRRKNIFPNVMMLFGHCDDNTRHKEDPHVHTDIFLRDNKWVRYPFAINFELTDTVATIKWWDPKNLKELYAPAIDRGPDYNLGGGIQYGSIRNNDTSQFELLAECKMSNANPLLIKTNIPHNVYYNTGYTSRLSLSLRFPIEQISSITEASCIF